MRKSFKKVVSLFLCFLMVLSCLNGYVFEGLGNIDAKALDNTPIAGDINGDGTVNNKDLTRLMKHIAGEDVEVVAVAIDTNGDGTVNNKDLTRLMKYIAGEGVELAPVGCEHSMTITAAKEANCTEAGNIAYWNCSVCGGYFSDETGMHSILFEDTVIESKGHTPVVDSAVAPTYESTGLTEGSHCSTCNTVLQAQEKIPMLKKTEYAITYDLYNGDTYLQSVGVTNNNPSVYASEDGLQLKNLKADGYLFLGWYDLPAGSNSEVVKSITAGTTGEIELYAHWEKIEYEVEFEFPTQFNAALVSLDKVTYTVDKGVVLPTPQLEGYIFAGWSDDDGNIIKKIPVGTTGAKQYTANWLSKRNQAWTKQKLDDPIIIEDPESNVILFTYEIGEIRNVPVYEIENFGYVNANGISKTVTKTFSTTVSESLMDTYTNTVANSTVNSYGWTLSNSWSDSTTIDEEWLKTQGMTKEEAESFSKSDTDGWYVSSGSSGSTTTETLNTVDSYDLKTNTANASHGGGSSTSDTHSSSLSNSITVDVDLNMEASAQVAGCGAKTSVDIGVSDTFSGSSSDSSTNTSNRNYSFSGGESAQGGSISHTGTNTTSNSSWNSESGYNGSSTVTSNSTLSKAISESISNKYGYGKTYISSGDNTSTQGISSTESSSDSYSSSVTYSTVRSEEQTISYTTSNTISGYHRWIMVDTAHVFAVVGYDIASSSYFVNTYTVMEDNLKPYEDYSCSSGNYDDNQNSFISFEVPYDIVTGYVGNRVGASDGLQVNSAGVITAYYGTDNYVVIPEYMVITNQDGTNKVIKVTGISENAFKGNTDITGVLMSSFIDEIPDRAFKGCTSLTEVQSCVSSIGAEAFAGCISMKAVKLGYGITSIGNNAFDSVEDITIYAINKSVVNAVVNSGAENITVYITDACESIDNTTLEIPETTEVFTFNGLGMTYTDLCITSEATKTVINRADFVSTGKSPLQFSSSEIQLQEVTVNAPAIGLICSSDNATLNLYGESYINSNNENAVLCKNLTLGKIKNDYFSQMHVSGNVLVCGEIKNESFISLEDGKIIYIDEETFDKYKQGTINVTFNANGGTVAETTKTVYYGQLYGTLPNPSRANYTFAGWYTATDGGAQITDVSTVTALVNQTLYAHWTPNKFTLTYNANGGSVSPSSRTLTFGDSYGTLPTPTRDYYNFIGWYTSASGGTQVSASTTPSSATNVTIYAHWELKPVSGWVKATEMPAGAQVVSQEWRYTLREYTSNSASSLSGWTKYDTKRTSWGATQGPVYTDPSNGSRNVWSEQYVTSSNYKTVYHYFRYAVNSTGGYGSYAQSASYPTYYAYDFDSPLEANGTSGGYNKFKYWYNGSNYISVYACSPYTTQEWVSDNYGTRWYYQEPVYTYYYYRDLSKTATSDPTGQANVSNVVKWVQYRAK